MVCKHCGGDAPEPIDGLCGICLSNRGLLRFNAEHFVKAIQKSRREINTWEQALEHALVQHTQAVTRLESY